MTRPYQFHLAKSAAHVQGYVALRGRFCQVKLIGSSHQNVLKNELFKIGHRRTCPAFGASSVY
ncbi:MAG: hypothetical protein AAFY15_03965, partial [Cyanobacteria bacterium J06648_11]